MQTVKLKTAKDILLDGVYKTSEKEDAPLIIYFGGNSDDATRFLLHIKDLKGFGIVAFNYRGYMQSNGKPTEKFLFSDALKIYDTYAKKKKIIVIGRSLGSGVASYLASKRKVNRVILITPYDSIVSLAKHKYPFLPIDLLLKYKFQSTKYIANVKCPVSVILVKDDTTIPRWSSENLIKKIKNLKSVKVLENTTHANVLNHPDFERTLQKAISRF
jgi:pimeloyl-ACP methyl ester carboxylesterase